MPQGRATRTIRSRWALERPRLARYTPGLTALFTFFILLPGCLPETKPGFYSPAPSKRLDAIVQASELEDDESLVKLVEKLRSHDSAERMLAIRSLESRTGNTLDYDHAAPHWKRVAAYNRWLEWLEKRAYILPEGMEPIETPTDNTNQSPEGLSDQQPMESEQP